MSSLQLLADTSFPPLLSLPLQAGLATTDTSCESVVTSGQQNVVVAAPQQQPPPRDASPAGYVCLPACRHLFLFSVFGMFFLL
jgi:hypothetical protein